MEHYHLLTYRADFLLVAPSLLLEIRTALTTIIMGAD